MNYPVLENPFILCTLLISFFAFGLVYRYLVRSDSLSFPHGIPRMGKSPGLLNLHAGAAKDDFLHNSKALLDEGYAKYKLSMFLVQTSDLPRVVLSAKYLEELRSLPESIISHRESVCDRFLGYWTGLDAVKESTLHNEICQTTLVQNLPALLPSMHEEAVNALEDSIGTASTPAVGYTSFDTYGSVFNMIARINSRVLVGFPLCRDPDWLKVAVGYPQDSVAVAMDLRPYLPWLRWLVYPFLASTKRLKNEYAIAFRKLTPLIAERRKATEARHADEKEVHKDLLQWMIDMGTGSDRKVDIIVRKMMFLTMAGFHAPTATAVHVIYDLCAHPEYLEPLRNEIEEELALEGGQWTLALLRRLKRLDSVIKESQRLNAPGLRRWLRCPHPPDRGRVMLTRLSIVSFNRKVLQPLTLSDGIRLPRGIIVTLPVHNITHDPANWPEPDTFDGFRFYEKRLAEPNREAEYQFAALGANSLGFGYGRFACPGRVFAAAQLKLLLGLLLLEYDFCFENETNKLRRPENIFMDDMVLPNRGIQVLCKKRA